MSAVLKGLSLTLQRGTITALVGRSGAGKTTVAALISRFYEPSRGTISLAGRDVRSFTRGEWARAVALVSQEPVLFEGAHPRPLKSMRLFVRACACVCVCIPGLIWTRSTQQIADCRFFAGAGPTSREENPWHMGNNDAGFMNENAACDTKHGR